MSSSSRTRGFTLIEVLVAIAIIGLLSAVILASLGSARVRGRDAARSVDVREIKKAMEFYYDDNKQYPKVGSENFANAIANLATPLTTGATKYVGAIAQILIDGNGTDTNLYAWKSTGTQAADPADSYAIVVYTESFGYPSGYCKTGAGPQYTSLFGSITTICSF